MSVSLRTKKLSYLYVNSASYGNILEYNGQIAKINNIRYKGYYYDKETNLYYLKSRYYDPSIGYLYQ